jgi:hypothetical protein
MNGKSRKRPKERNVSFATIAGPAVPMALWLLLMPPTTTDGKMHLEAPLRQWDVLGHVHGSAKECEAALGEMLHRLSFHPAGTGLTTPSDQYEFNRAVMMSRCVSTDDPRLREKSN